MVGGAFELLFLAVIGVLLLGPEQTSKYAYKLGCWIRDVQKMSREFSSELTREAELDDIRNETKKKERAIVTTGQEFKADDLKDYHAGAATPFETASSSLADAGTPAPTEDHIQVAVAEKQKE